MVGELHPRDEVGAVCPGTQSHPLGQALQELLLGTCRGSTVGEDKVKGSGREEGIGEHRVRVLGVVGQLLTLHGWSWAGG